MAKFKIGLQLYSVRDDMQKDFEGTIKKVKEMGYDVVEFAGYYGHDADEIKALLEKYDLECVSVHQKYEAFLEDEEAMVEFQRKLGIKYSIIPWMDRSKQADKEVFPQTIKEIKTVAKALSKIGVKMGYHNHEFEFETYNDEFLIDLFRKEFTDDEMFLQVDTCWCKYAGYDPAEYIKKYNGKIPVLHLKDFTADKSVKAAMYALIDETGKETKAPTRDENGFKFKPLGEGQQDFPSIIKSAEEIGVQYLIVEQDGHPDYEPLESVRRSREYLKSLGL